MIDFTTIRTAFGRRIEPVNQANNARQILLGLLEFSKVEPEIGKIIPFDCHRSDVSGNVPTFAVLVLPALNAHPVAVKQLPSRLLEREGTVFLDLLEAGRRGLDFALKIAEEQVVRLVNARPTPAWAHHVLNGLRANQVPMRIARQLLEPGYVSHQVVPAQSLTRQTIVAAVPGDAVVIDQPGNVYLPVQALILFRAVELEFVGSDNVHRFF
jgi:hypothetical protein